MSSSTSRSAVDVAHVLRAPGKTRPSFFYYTELERVLQTLGVSRLIAAGLQTNVCVEATVRCGLARNFEVAVPEDAVSTDGPDLHWAGLIITRCGCSTLRARPGVSWSRQARWDRAFTTPDYGRDPQYRIKAASA